MNVLKIDENRFLLRNDDLYNFKVFRSAQHLPRGLEFWINTCINRLKHSHSVKLEYIKDIVESNLEPRWYTNTIKQEGSDIHVMVFDISGSNIFSVIISPKNKK